MKKLLGLALAGTAVATAMTGCGGSADTSINVYVRNSSSGTREAFTGAAFDGVDEADEIDAEDNDGLISGFSEVSGTSDMIAGVEGDENGIGYISLASLSGTDLKALDFDGVEANAANVTDGSYSMSRGFAQIVANGSTPTDGKANISATDLELITEWNNFLLSTDGKAILEDEGVIVDASDYTNAVKYVPGTVCSGGTATEINIGGSTSVEDAGKALSAALAVACTDFKPVHAHGGSGDSEDVLAGDMHIGFSSSGLRSGYYEADGTTLKPEGTASLMGQDAVVVVVNEANSVTNLSQEELQQIFYSADATGAVDSNITSWADLA